MLLIGVVIVVVELESGKVWVVLLSIFFRVLGVSFVKFVFVDLHEHVKIGYG